MLPIPDCLSTADCETSLATEKHCWRAPWRHLLHLYLMRGSTAGVQEWQLAIDKGVLDQFILP